MNNDLFPRESRRSLPIALLRAREAIMRHFRPMLAAHDLTEQQWRVLRVLAEKGDADVTHIVEAAHILAPSLTRIIASLDERGLIERRQGEDRRRVELKLTAAGEAIIAEVMPDSAKIYAMLQERFGPEKIAALLDLLEALQAINEAD